MGKKIQSSTVCKRNTTEYARVCTCAHVCVHTDTCALQVCVDADYCWKGHKATLSGLLWKGDWRLGVGAGGMLLPA